MLVPLADVLFHTFMIALSRFKEARASSFHLITEHTWKRKITTSPTPTACRGSSFIAEICYNVNMQHQALVCGGVHARLHWQ